MNVKCSPRASRSVSNQAGFQGHIAVLRGTFLGCALRYLPGLAVGLLLLMRWKKR
jgi:hypothetical protein